MKKYIDLIMGIFAIIYVIIINSLFGKITFSEFFLFIGFILIIFHFLKNKLKNLEYRNKYFKNILNIGKIFILIGIIVFICIELVIIIFPKHNSSKSNYVIILGAGVKGETPSLTLSQRLEKAIEYINSQNHEVKVLVSGGQGKGEEISEAEAMKRYLIKSGIEVDIIKEDKSTDTRENLIFSKKIIEDIEGENISNINIKIITSDFHAFRSNLIAKSLGYDNSTFFTNRTLPILMPVMYLREFFAIGKYFLVEILDKI